MKLDEAIKEVIGDRDYENIKGHLSRPELIKFAAVECFTLGRDDTAASTIRAALIFLKETGQFPK